MSQFDYKQRASKTFAENFDAIFGPMHTVGPHKVVWTQGVGTKHAICRCVRCGQTWEEGGVYAPTCGDRA